MSDRYEVREAVEDLMRLFYPHEKLSGREALLSLIEIGIRIGRDAAAKKVREMHVSASGYPGASDQERMMRLTRDVAASEVGKIDTAAIAREALNSERGRGGES